MKGKLLEHREQSVQPHVPASGSTVSNDDAAKAVSVRSELYSEISSGNDVNPPPAKLVAPVSGPLFIPRAVLSRTKRGSKARTIP